jgi:hypothetical protein
MKRIDGYARNTPGHGHGPGYGARLRPTGMVVFATLEETRPTARIRAGVALAGARHAELPGDWRHRALRGVAWLLGR